MAAGFDPIVGAATVLLGAGTGVLGSTINPFATGAAVAADGTEPLTRREAARMTDEALHPFDRDIDFEGNLIK